MVLDEPVDPASDISIKRGISQVGTPLVLASDLAKTPFLEGVASGHVIASAGIPVDDDGVVRSSAHGMTLARAALVAGKRQMKTEDSERIAGWPLNRSGNPPFIVVPAHLVARGQVDPALFAGKVVFVGVTVPGRDQHETPLSRTGRIDEPLPGVLVHAYFAYNMLEATPGPRWYFWLDAGLVIFLALLGSWLGLRLWSAGVRLLSLFALNIIVILGVFELFSRTLIIAWLLPPSLALFASAGLAAMYAQLNQTRTQAKLEKVFGNYVGQEVLAMVKQGAHQLPTSPQSLDLSIMFCDLADFTSLVAREDDAFIREFLGEYIDGICQIIIAHGGIVDNVMGDGILALFGIAGGSDPRPAAHNCALEIIAATRAMANDRRLMGYGRTCIGLHHGTAMFGSIGGEARRVFSAYGINVNIASRLQELCKEIGVAICATAEAVDDLAFAENWVNIETSSLKGVPFAVKIRTLRHTEALLVKG